MASKKMEEASKKTEEAKDKPQTTKKVAVQDPNERMFELMGLLYKPHPWHGLNPGADAPLTVTAYIECVPGEGIKYEVDKPTGYLKVDRPHKYSSLCPSIYGFLPQTYCGPRVAERAMERNPVIGKIHGDGDPIDICVLSTRDIKHGDLILSCRPIGGLRMIDDGEADDKIIAVLVGDPLMSGFTDVAHIPKSMLDMLRHYFLTYKQSPDVEAPKVSIPEVYGREEAYEMIKRSMADYQDKFVSLKKDFAKSIMSSLRRELAASLATD